MTNFIYLLGPAGCGKSTLASALSEEFESYGLKCPVLNLDPGVDWLPYEPEIDIRKDISLANVMKEFKLGPNGALVVAVDLMINHLPRIRERVTDWNPEYVIVDTPGQMELFAFRETGPAVMEALNPGKDSLVLFLIDSFLAKRASSFISMLMLATSVLTRFMVPQINLLTKVDAVEAGDVERAVNWATRQDMLLEAVEEEPNPLGRETALSLLEAVGKVGFTGELMPVSSSNHGGITELVSAIQGVFSSEGELDLGEEKEKY
jgi:hypothetical protein